VISGIDQNRVSTISQGNTEETRKKRSLYLVEEEKK
jgi:hypothetical protein